MTTFVDRVVLHVAAGNGGHGVASVKREKFKPLGGPDGGNGGKGGSVILAVDPQSTTLLDYHHTPHRKATNGKPGGGDERNGADGGDLVLPVPEGTVVKDGNGSVLADLVGHDATFVVARGGRGGLGNKALASPAAQGPRLRPARRARRVDRHRARAEVARRRRADRLPERRQVLAGLGDVGRPPQDRRLPVHHPGAQPRGRHRRVAALHHGRRARAASRAPARARAWAWSSCATSSAARCSCTSSTARRSSRAATR